MTAARRRAKRSITLYQGPRVKSLATYHLEYIVYALLDKHSTVNIVSNKKNEMIVTVNHRAFNLTNILTARPDFEQLTLNEAVLDAYANNNALSSHSNHLKQWHAAEQHALNLWSDDSDYRVMNAILRDPHNTAGDYNTDEVRKFLPVICLAARALSRPYDSASTISQATRTEDYVLGLEKLRNKKIRNNELFVSEGFYASTYTGIPEYAQVLINFNISPGLNPIGKSISHVSSFTSELEVLFPPNTEFHLSGNSKTYEATPVRTINAEVLNQNPAYSHSFSAEELVSINHEKAKTEINLLIEFIQNKIGEEKSFFASFFAKPEKLTCFKKIESLLEDLNQDINPTSANEFFIKLNAVEASVKSMNNKSSFNVIQQTISFIKTCVENTVAILDQSDLRDIPRPA